MNILFINTKGKFGGVVGWMCRVISALEKRNHNCWVISIKKSELIQYAPDNLNIIQIGSVSDFSPSIITFIYQFIKKNQIQLVFTNTTKEISVGGISAKLAGIPNIRRVGNYTDLNDTWKNKFLTKFFVNHTIAPCQAILDQAEDTYHWLKRDKYTVIYNGRNPESIDTMKSQQLKATWQIPEDAFVFGMNVQLVRVKGIIDVINAFSQVIAKHPNTYLVICGEGNLKEEINQSRKKLNLEKQIIMAGFQQDVLGWSAIYDVGILSSYDEGFPNTIVEYMASGKPVIASNVGGVSEIVCHEKNGLLFQAGDMQTLTDYMGRMLEDSECTLKMGENALQTIREQFTEKIMIDKTIELMNSVIIKKL